MKKDTSELQALSFAYKLGFINGYELFNDDDIDDDTLEIIEEAIEKTNKKFIKIINK